jgi:hypothetical protein
MPEVTVGLSYPDVHKLDEIAKATGSKRTEVIRLAISQFLANYGKEPEKQYESILEARLRKMENRLADLTVLAARASAQTLYYMTLPYSRGGFPTRPLKEEVFQGQWQKSRAFASQFLKNATLDLTPPASETESQAS